MINGDFILQEKESQIEMNLHEHYERKGSFEINFPIDKVFPLICPKKEEEWIPGWQCDVLFSKTNYNEDGAVFKTEKAYGSELYWFTNKYNINDGIVEFIIFAKDLYVFKFKIVVTESENNKCTLTAVQNFTPLSIPGAKLIEQYKAEDFNAMLCDLGKLMSQYLQAKQ